MSGVGGNQADDFGSDGLIIEVEGGGFGFSGIVFEQGEQEMFGADEIVTESERFGAGVFQ